jgi:hypothetical protein
MNSTPPTNRYTEVKTKKERKKEERKKERKGRKLYYFW